MSAVMIKLSIGIIPGKCKQIFEILKNGLLMTPAAPGLLPHSDKSD